jgi:peptidyl-prolyl cis-trans isomerase A (cyclophilin A)
MALGLGLFPRVISARGTLSGRNTTAAGRHPEGARTMIRMIHMTRFIPALVLGLFLVCSPQLAAEEKQTSSALKDPSAATAAAPEVFKVKVETTAGDFVIEVHREWAPNGADRFYNLVKMGYYDDAAFFRVIDGFMAQVGFHSNPEVTAAWAGASIEDDPIVKSNTKGMVTFAMKATPNSRTTQFFINYGDNSYLKNHGKFAPFGKVIEGMKVVESLYSGYGEGAPSGKGPSQMKIFKEGNAYLKAEFPKLDYILSTTLVSD